jgi:hypothetical protein
MYHLCRIPYYWILYHDYPVPTSEADYRIAKKWTMPVHDWKPALNRFAIEFAGRFPQ